MPDDTQPVSDLELERRRLATEIARLQEQATQTRINPKTNQPELSDDAYAAQKRLEKLNDDYRALLIAMKPSTAGTIGEIKDLPNGAPVRITPDNRAVPIDTSGLPPGSMTKAQTPQIVGGRLYVPDPNSSTGWSPVTPQDPKDVQALADIAQREYNKALTGRYMTDEESLKYQADLNKLGNDQAAAKRLQDEYEQKARIAEQDFKQKATLFPINVEQAGANVASTKASTAGTQASTQQTLQNIDVQKAKLPGELEQQALTREGTRLSNAQAQQTLEQGRAPTIATTPTGMYQWQRDPNTGAVTAAGMNPEYVPKTMPEVMARVGQINDAMQRKSAEVQAKVGQTIGGKLYTNDDALREYNQWHDQQVAPQAGAIQAAQQQALQEQARLQAEQQRSNYATAINAGTGYTNAAQLEMQHRVGPGFQQAMNQIAAGQGKGVDLGSAIGYRAPSVTQGAQDAVNQALKNISPGAAAAVGGPLPNFSGIDINAALAPTRYMQGGGMGGPPPPGAPTAVADPTQRLDGGTGWQRADQMYGGAPAGNAMWDPNDPNRKPAGWVDPNSPVFLGRMLPDFTYGGG